MYQHYLNVLWQERIHVERTALTTAGRLTPQPETIWDLAQEYLKLLSPLPDNLFRWWLSQPAGHIVIGNSATRYVPGSQTWQISTLEAVTYISVSDVLARAPLAFYATVQLLDHLMGSGAKEPGGRFSAGAGVTPGLSRAAQQFHTIELLQYGHEELGVGSAADYLCHSLWMQLVKPIELNRIDPVLARLFKRTLLAEVFWRRQLAAAT